MEMSYSKRYVWFNGEEGRRWILMEGRRWSMKYITL